MEFTKDAIQHLSASERNAISDRIKQMLDSNNEVEVHFKVGSHTVRIRRSSSIDASIEADMMTSSLEANDKLVNRYNKRKKS